MTEFLPYATGTFDFVGSKVSGCKPHILKSVTLSISDSVSDDGRDLLKDILPNNVMRKLNLILLLCGDKACIPT